MSCLRCGETARRRIVHSFRRTIEGCAFVAEVEVDGCTSCDDVIVPVPLLLAFEKAIAIDLARRGPATGETFRFIRKAVPLSPAEVARMLGASIDTVSRWESGRRAIDLPSWLVVATIALETFDQPSPLLGRLRAIRDAHKSERVLAIEAAPIRRTLREALALLSGPVLLTDADIADALGVAPEVLRDAFEALSAATQLVAKREVQSSGAIRWVPCGESGVLLAQRARDAGFDVDRALT